MQNIKDTEAILYFLSVTGGLWNCKCCHLIWLEAQYLLLYSGDSSSLVCFSPWRRTEDSQGQRVKGREVKEIFYPLARRTPKVVIILMS